MLYTLRLTFFFIKSEATASATKDAASLLSYPPATDQVSTLTPPTLSTQPIESDLLYYAAAPVLPN
jgi:hypothetical protein